MKEFCVGDIVSSDGNKQYYYKVVALSPGLVNLSVAGSYARGEEIGLDTFPVNPDGLKLLTQVDLAVRMLTS